MNQPDTFVIETNGLGKSFGDVKALQNVNFRVPRHSIFGFLGPNGAGKTTLMKVLLGLTRPTAGSGTIFGHDIVTESVAIREHIGYLAQQPRFIEHMTARENLLFTAKFFFSGPETKLRSQHLILWVVSPCWICILAIWTVILSQDLIIGEKQSGVAEWLLSKPVMRRSYVLAKLTANALPVTVLLVGLPSVLASGMLSLRMGAPFPLSPFLSAVGIMTAHTLFYLTFTLMLGTIFNNRSPILGFALASVLGGGMLGGFIKPLFYVTPWVLPKVAWLTSTGQAIPTELRIASLVATVSWSVVFVFVALAKFEKMEC